MRDFSAPNHAAAGIVALLLLAHGGAASALTSVTTLADQPIFATNNVPGNLAFTLSVEYPTAISVANLGSYNDAQTYLGYFDPAKCYQYNYNPGSAANDAYNYTTAEASYFQPAAFATGVNGHSCSGKWSGNFMNWATMQTIDPFRWALTGGYRSWDSPTQTILEKAWGASEGGVGNFPYRGVDQPSGQNIALSLVPYVTPFTNWTDMNTAIWGNGNAMLISAGSGYKGWEFSTNTQTPKNTASTNIYDLPSNVNVAAPTPEESQYYSSTAVPNTAANKLTYRVYIRVSVCDTSILGVLGLESNCVGYGTPSASGVYPNYKPQGLIQQYSNQIKYSVFGYLNTQSTAVQGGVLREPMEFVGPTYPTPFSTTVTTNPNAEWKASDGTMPTNPDPTSAAATGSASVTQSGVMNYINSFGEYGGQQFAKAYTNPPSAYQYNQNIYMQYDHVSELYYAAVRYYENLGNVPQWLPQSGNGTTPYQLDGFPALPNWTDPIAYRCQNNFILGIGDDHTWTDYNVGGSIEFSQNIYSHNPVPPAVQSDSFNQANTWLNELQKLEGLQQQPWWAGPEWTPSYAYGAGDNGSTFYIAGLAYGTHVLDIRPDLKDTQTISTYWMDVAEYQEVEDENPYYLATKYGGFKVPSGYSITNTTPLTLGEYDTSGQNVNMNNGLVLPQPDNYFEAGYANQMVSSLTAAFSDIALAAQNSTTAFSVANPNIASAGALSFAASYNSTGWTGTVAGYTLTFPGGTPTETQVWSTDTVLQSQLANNGWQSARKVVTYSNGSTCGPTYAGAPFEPGNLCSTQLSALVPSSYSSSTTSTQYLDYLRGDTTNEVGSTKTGSTKSLRARTLFLGDIVDANLTPVGTPSMSYSEGYNPGYAAFTAAYTTTNPRPTMVYAAANDGMVHGFLGTSGTEVFAYVPSALYQGPTATPQTNGLAALGNPNYAHRYYVDATPGAFDLDLNNTYQSGSTTPNWHTLLIGGLGKGGTSFYAIDVTDPASMESATETQIAQKVLWEFTDSTMGYSFTTPVVVKTARYGWVVLLTSGYDNSDGYGYLYVINPRNGALLQKIKTPNTSSGLTQVSAYVADYTNYTADSAYVGDLNGQLWRFDLTETTVNYPAPTLLAELTDPSGNAQPVTSPPLIEIHPTTRERYVLIGTGQLLASGDVGSTQVQSFYGIIDGTAGSFNQAVTSPVTRSNLTQVTSITAGVTIPAGSKGWYYNLPAGYRVITIPVAYNGIVGFAALLPSSADPCVPGGSSEVYAVNYSTGQSVINATSTGTSGSGSTTPAPYESFSTGVINLKIVSNNGTPELIAGDTKGNLTQVGANLTGVLTTHLLNWREIPTPE